MFDVTCSSCGQPTKVPFQPRGDRPVYCRDCFDRVGGGGGGGRTLGVRLTIGPDSSFDEIDGPEQPMLCSGPICTLIGPTKKNQDASR